VADWSVRDPGCVKTLRGKPHSEMRLVVTFRAKNAKIHPSLDIRTNQILFSHSQDPFRSSARPKSRTATRAQRAPEWHLPVRPSAQDAPSPSARRSFRNYTLRSVDNVEKFLSGLDRAQWRHTLRIVHRHYRVFQRGRRGATLRKGRSMMGQARQCTCAEGQRTGRSIDRSEPCHGWPLMR
jgi:hypothetical protein